MDRETERKRERANSEEDRQRQKDRQTDGQRDYERRDCVSFTLQLLEDRDLHLQNLFGLLSRLHLQRHVLPRQQVQGLIDLSKPPTTDLLELHSSGWLGSPSDMAPYSTHIQHYIYRVTYTYTQNYIDIYIQYYTYTVLLVGYCIIYTSGGFSIEEREEDPP